MGRVLLFIGAYLCVLGGGGGAGGRAVKTQRLLILFSCDPAFLGTGVQ